MFQIGKNIAAEIRRIPDYRVVGRVTAVLGLLVEIGGVEGSLSIGDRCKVRRRDGDPVICEVVGFRNERALLMPFGALDGIGIGCSVELSDTQPQVFPDDGWLGRVVNAFGEPVDGKGPLPQGIKPYAIRSTPPSAHSRQRVSGKIDLGVRAMNTFLTCCRGQRMGIFAGSGVGKSSLLSMMTRHTTSDVAVVGLIGERGREAREFIEDDLGEEGLRRSVVVVSTSDEPPLMRRQAAYMTLAISEFFRDQGRDVLCMMDSVTRFAMAQREISLSVGEPPASKGYTPTVFAELPRLLERAGPGGPGQGSITGLFTVLVDGDDHNEPISDAVRGILDGHVVLDRAIAEQGRYPAINILRSVSRTMPGCNSDNENYVVQRARKLLATYNDMAELIRLGAYRRGADPKVDEAIHYFPLIEEFLSQGRNECTRLAEGYLELARRLDMLDEPAAEAPAASATGPAQGGGRVISQSRTAADLNAAKRALGGQG
ncbi:flagellar protein export ATPase FliI [Thalassospira sp.]|uniref:flagellar protein export ATPase FliI n=1 Tax=Thalassospira sp. TaxID=1912094 RepID=UPI00273612AD|nr:flagellar protein export ATPase FliI [Thalassospira sp.]MDP2696626.1 flagellar protein export ATPase FliI [Thalassospira sp.]